MPERRSLLRPQFDRPRAAGSATGGDYKTEPFRRALGDDGSSGALCGTDAALVPAARNGDFPRAARPGAGGPYIEMPDDRLLYDGSTDRCDGYHYLSKEWDWRGLGAAPQADAVIAFANNLGWDQVVESRAGTLVLCDWQPAPLVAQETIFRPLIVSSRTPAEFVSRVYGEPPPVEDASLPVERLCAAYDARDKTPTPDQRRQFCHGVLAGVERMLGDSGVTDEQLSCLRGYYQALCELRAGAAAPRPFPLPCHDIGAPAGAARDMAAEFYDDLRGRYVARAGSKPSCLSSAENFRRLQAVFRDSVYYAKGDLRDMHTFAAIRAALGPRRFALNLSNVIGLILCLHWQAGLDGDSRFGGNPFFYYVYLLRGIVAALDAGERAISLRFTDGTSAGREYFAVECPPGVDIGDPVYQALCSRFRLP